MLGTISQGIMVSGSLIIAIGSQNAFVLKQGILKQNVFIVCMICFLCDFLLIGFGVLGFGAVISQSKLFTLLLAFAGFLFLFSYGALAFRRAYKGNQLLHAGKQQVLPLKKVVALTLAITLLNPHVYLDTVVIIGAFAATFTLTEKLYFLLGASLVSLVWFFALGFGARFLIRWFEKPKTWQVLEIFIGLLMWWLASHMLIFVLAELPNFI